MINLLLYPISILPVILIYMWLKKKILVDETHQKLGKQALINGFLVTIPAVILSALLSHFLDFVFRLEPGILRSLLYALFAIALSEELSKYFMMQRLVKKNNVGYSWLDIIVYMMIVAIGFDILESAVYAFTGGPAQVIVRGITLPHLSYGFMMGYFAGKAIKTKNKLYYIPALLLPLALHGIYDFSLDADVLEYDFTAVIALALALAELIVAIISLVFVKKAKQKEKYTEIIC